MNKYYKDKRVLVTGGAGFIGSYLVKSLVKAQAKVTVLDNLTTGSLDNLTEVLDKINFIKESIESFDTLLKSTFHQNIVFHCAATVSMPLCNNDPQGCYHTNITGTFNTLHASSLNKVQRVIFSSSSAVYGEYKHPISESLDCQPISTYGYSKLMGEQLCQLYGKAYNLNTIALRYFNVYHHNQHLKSITNVITHFKYNMLNNLPITIYGDGTQTRDFIHVDKVVQANLIAGIYGFKKAHEIINVGSGSHLTILELINRLKKEFPDYNQPLIFKPARPGDIINSQANCTKLASIIKDFNYIQQAPKLFEQML